MPYPFALPTISAVDFTVYYHSPVYPSLPLLITTHRGSLRNILKAHKRLPPQAQNANLPTVTKALETYLPHLLFLQSSLHEGDILPQDSAPGPIESSWSSTLTATAFGTDPPRVQRTGLEYELFFTLATLATSHSLQSRSHLLSVLSPSSSLTKETSQQLLNQAITHLLTAASIYNHILALPPPPTANTWPLDISSSMISSLSLLALADATLLAVTKQDPYPSYLSLVTPKKSNKSLEWLYNPPDPPTGAKASMLSRVCLAASDHATKALGLLGSASSSEDKDRRLTPDLTKYLDDLRKVSRAKACRFLGIDAEVGGRVGEAIGWMLVARGVLGIDITESNTLKKLRRDYSEKKEAKAMEKADASWGADAGRLEEARVVEGLEKRWRKNNDKVFFQPIEEKGVLVPKIPTGREVHKVGEWEPPKLGNEEIKSLRGRIADLDDELEKLALGEEVKKTEGTTKSASSTVGYY